MASFKVNLQKIKRDRKYDFVLHAVRQQAPDTSDFASSETDVLTIE